MLKRNIHNCKTPTQTIFSLGRVASIGLGSQADGRAQYSGSCSACSVLEMIDEHFPSAETGQGSTHLVIQITISAGRTHLSITSVTVRLYLTRLRHGFHVVAVRMRSHEFDFYSWFCSNPPPPPPPGTTAL